MSQNGISTAVFGSGSDPVANKLLRRDLKLASATTKRSIADTPGYRELNVIAGTHPAYVNGLNGATTSTVSGTASPTIGRPWAV